MQTGIGKMASSTAMECGICNEIFDEHERSPRSLLCGHCLCTSCITKLIFASNTTCPFCRVRFQANSAQEFKINHSLVDLLKYASQLEAGATSQSRASNLASTEWLKVLEKKDSGSAKDLSISQNVQGHVEKRIQLNNELRTKMETEILPEITQIEAFYREKGEFLNKENKQLHKYLKAIKQNQKQIDEVEKKLGSGTSFLEAAALMEEAGKAYSQVQSLSANATDSLSRGEATCQRIAQIVQQSQQTLRNLKDVLTTISQVDLQAMPDLNTLTLQEPGPENLMVESLRKMKGKAMELAKNGLLFSLLEQEGKRRFAKITITSDRKLCLYPYVDTLPTAGSHIIEHEHILKLVDQHSRLAFIELKNRKYGSDLGRCCVRLAKDTLKAKNFACLCTGELGPTFVNSNFLEIHEKNTGMERVLCGDYERNNGCGGKILVPGSADEGKGEWDTDWLAGSVVGLPNATDENGSQFFIRTQDVIGLRCEVSFGRVEGGIDVLRNAICHHKSGLNVYISNCGMVLNSE